MLLMLEWLDMCKEDEHVDTSNHASTSNVFLVVELTNDENVRYLDCDNEVPIGNPFSFINLLEGSHLEIHNVANKHDNINGVHEQTPVDIYEKLQLYHTQDIDKEFVKKEENVNEKLEEQEEGLAKEEEDNDFERDVNELPHSEPEVDMQHFHFKIYRGRIYKDFLWKCATTTTVAQFEKLIDDLKCFNPKAHKWLQKIPPSSWERFDFSDASLVTKGIALDASLSTDGVALDASLVTEGITLDAGLVVKQSTFESNTSLEQLDKSSSLGNGNRSLDNESNSSGNYLDAKKRLVDTTTSDIENDNIGPSYDSDTRSEVNHDMFENVVAYGIQNHEQLEPIPDTYVVNENNSDIISDIPNMGPDRGNEEHDDQANALLTNELERFKEKEKYFAKDETIESKYCKKIKLLDDEISNLKSQACKKYKAFARKMKSMMYFEKQDRLIRLFECCFQKKTMLIWENKALALRKNDVENPSLLNKAKELAPCLYNIDGIRKDLLSHHKIISEEELKCKAEKRLKVKYRKSPLSYHDFVYGETQFEEPPKVSLKNHLKQLEQLKQDEKLNMQCLKSLPMKQDDWFQT
nr:hypothetical protein [Tanacetum cinerariifolium]